MQCKELEAVLEQDGDSPLPAAAQEHLARCRACQELVADFSTIIAVAKELPGEVDPPERVWVSLRAQMEAEGLIKEPVEVPLWTAQATWWGNFSTWLRPRTLATAGVGVVLVVG